MIAVYEYGSVARKQHDSLSDVDILCLYDGILEPTDFDRFTPLLCERNYVSKRELSDLASYGSLFVEHLRKEGRQIHDTANLLDQCLNKFVEKVDWRAEIWHATQNIPSTASSDYWCNLCVADATYVIARDVWIKMSSMDGDTIFDIESLAERYLLTEIDGLDESFIQLARNLKYNYRRRAQWGNVEEIVYIAERIRQSLTSLASRRIGYQHELPYSNGYLELRNLEVALIEEYGIFALDSGECPNHVQDIWAYIRTPSSAYPKNKIIGFQKAEVSVMLETRVVGFDQYQ